YRHYDFMVSGLDATVSVRPLWASEQLHAYFYDVPVQYATTARAPYLSDKGYFGTGINFHAKYRLNDKASVFFSVQTTSHHGAANQDSPLHEKDFTMEFGAGFMWSLRSSRQLVR